MENFEALKDIDSFCKVIVKKPVTDRSKDGVKQESVSSEKIFSCDQGTNASMGYTLQPGFEEPLVDVFDEQDHIRILVQCRCREQQVTFHPSEDGITICKEECHKERGEPEKCTDVCSKLNLKTDKLQLENMLFIIAKCNNNNTLEAMIPKIRQ